MSNKVTKIALLISFIIFSCNGLELKCETEGCYEVIKTFVKLLEEKINETDKILTEAERELNEVTLGGDENFQSNILELDNRLGKLLIEMKTGIDGGEHSLFDLINSVFKDLNQAEVNADKIEVAIDDNGKITKIAEVDVSNLSETIRKISEEFSKMQNQTETDLPTALQDAFDRSEKFHDDAKELRDVLDMMKLIHADYERNLLNAKDLTSLTLEKFKDVTKHIDTTSEYEKYVEEMLNDENEQKLPTHEVENVKKLVKDASDKAKIIFEDSLELFNVVSLLELYSKFDDIKKKIEELNEYSEDAKIDLKDFSNENSKFLDELEVTLDKAEKLKVNAMKKQDEIKELLEEVQKIHVTSKKAVDDKEEIISNARNIYKILEDFNMRVEETRENALRAFEKIPEIQKKIIDSKDIVKNLEDQAEENMKMATEAKEKCAASKSEMDKVLKQSSEIQNAVEIVANKLDDTFEKMTEIQKVQDQSLNQQENMRRLENETENLIQKVKEKVERTKAKENEVDSKVNLALENLHDLMAVINSYKDVDPAILEEFESKINDLEQEIKDSKLDERHKSLKEQRQHQDELIEKYRMEIAVLEHEVETIKENADSLENKCFKRTRLEP